MYISVSVNPMLILQQFFASLVEWPEFTSEWEGSYYCKCYQDESLSLMWGMYERAEDAESQQICKKLINIKVRELTGEVGVKMSEICANTDCSWGVSEDGYIYLEAHSGMRVEKRNVNEWRIHNISWSGFRYLCENFNNDISIVVNGYYNKFHSTHFKALKIPLSKVFHGAKVKIEWTPFHIIGDDGWYSAGEKWMYVVRKSEKFWKKIPVE